MKNNLLRYSLLAAALALPAGLLAQQAKISPWHGAVGQAASVRHYVAPETGQSALPQSIPLAGLPSTVTIPNADGLPVTGFGHQPQSDGRALHNIQVDPSNPLNVHAVIMQLASSNPKDTTLSSRRVYYMFSHDGGKTWGTPITLGTVKTGFPCMVLYKRGSNYVPVIAAHRILPQDTVHIESALWVEKGAPGDGNFQMTECGRVAADGTNKDILWPYIAVSPDGSKVYMVGSVSLTNGDLADFIQFGTFNLDADGTAHWNGWSQTIGANNGNHTYSGYAQIGNYVLQVSPAGKVGLLWRSADYATPEASLYFIESNDGGATWPQGFDPLLAQQATTSAGIYDGPWNGMDFYYNGENPRFIFTETETNYNNLDASGNPQESYYPSVARLHFFDGSAGQDVVTASTIPNDATAQYPLDAVVAAYPVGSSIKEGDLWIGFPTLAHTDDPRFLSVYYDILPATDSVQFSDTSYHLYSSIYFQNSYDGGATWTAPAPLNANPTTPSGYGRFDFRSPQVSGWNPIVAANFTPHIMFSVDTAAGEEAATGGKDWDQVNYFHQTQQFSGVHSVAPVATLAIQNYPNPFIGSTTISYSTQSPANATMIVTDVLGRTVATLLDGAVTTGSHQLVFDASSLPAGTYRCTLTTNGESVTKTMSVVK